MKPNYTDCVARRIKEENNMSMIKQGWEEIIQRSDKPRAMFDAFLDTASMAGNSVDYVWEGKVYIPPDATEDEILDILAGIQEIVRVDEQINKEYLYQKMVWPEKYDDSHSDIHWKHILTQRIHLPGIEFRKRMVQVAAMAKSAIAAYDRKYS